ncbi:glycerate kinase [Metabacillus sp. HB246100]
MKILLAPDSFKGSLSAVGVAQAMERGIKKAFPNSETICMPIGDGGEGTLETLITATNGITKQIKVTGPLGHEIMSEYGVLGDGKTCIIEMAKASGLALVDEKDLNPLKTTTYGTGELIRQALDDGYTSFILALGGSATNDGGVGMLQALGLKVVDVRGEEIGYGGGELAKVHRIDATMFDPRIQTSTFLIASDVENPFVGPNGASHVFGPQKGATMDMVRTLDANLSHWGDCVENTTGSRIHDVKGAGAAGGIGGAFQVFFPSEMRRGIDVVIDHIGFHKAIDGADLVITGEGQVDDQTASGKTPMGVAQAAQSYGIPTIILAGSIGKGIEVLHRYGVVSVNSIINRPMTLHEAMENAGELIEFSTEQVVRSYFCNHEFQKRKVVLNNEN